MDAVHVGIDVSKDWLDVHVLPSGEAFRVDNDAGGFDRLKARLCGLKPERVAFEATGGLETPGVAELSAAGLAVVVINPAQVRSFAQALGKRAKTDPIDAGVIAAFAAAMQPELRPLPDSATRLLGDLVARRRQIMTMIVAEQNRLRSATAKQTQKSIKRLLAALRRELESIGADMDGHSLARFDEPPAAAGPHRQPLRRACSTCACSGRSCAASHSCASMSHSVSCACCSGPRRHSSRPLPARQSPISDRRAVSLSGSPGMVSKCGCA